MLSLRLERCEEYSKERILSLEWEAAPCYYWQESFEIQESVGKAQQSPCRKERMNAG